MEDDSPACIELERTVAKWVRGRKEGSLDLKSLIENDIQAELSRAKGSPEDLEGHIRAAFMNGMVLGAKLQARLPDEASDQEGWCALPEPQES